MIYKIRIRNEREKREKKRDCKQIPCRSLFLNFPVFILSIDKNNKKCYFAFVCNKRMEVNSSMKYIRGNYSVQLIKLTGVSLLSADCAEDN